VEFFELYAKVTKVDSHPGLTSV